MTAQSVASLWLGKPLSDFEKVSLSSFVSYGFNVSLFVYDFKMSVPEGVVLQDAREVLDESRIFENPLYPGTWATFSDVFRYLLVASTDNIWIDTDVIALKAELPEVNGYTFGWQDADVINGGILGAPRHSPLVELLCSRVADLETESIPWGKIGPDLLSEVVGELGLEEVIQSTQVFYPVPWLETWRFFDPRETEKIQLEVKDSSAIHWWNEVVRRAPMNIKQFAPPKGSFMRLVFDSFDYDLSDRPVLDSNWVRDKWKGNTGVRIGHLQRAKIWARKTVARRGIL